jgi:hypothetical protein
MIVTDKFVFIHLHKSGGTFVNEVIQRLFPCSQHIGYHYTLRMLPSEYSHLPILGVVRNPWDFYVSYYAFQKSLIAQSEAKLATLSSEEVESLANNNIDSRNGIDILFELLSDNGNLDFTETTTNLLNLSHCGQKFDHILEMMPRELGRRTKFSPHQRLGFRGMNLTRDDLATMRDTGIGLYGFLFKHMYGKGEGIYFAQRKTLRQDIITFLTSIGIELNEQETEYILNAKPKNSSQRDRYPEYYTPALKNLVRDRDAFIIDKFNFQF